MSITEAQLRVAVLVYILLKLFSMAPERLVATIIAQLIQATLSTLVIVARQLIHPGSS